MRKFRRRQNKIKNAIIGLLLSFMYYNWCMTVPNEVGTVLMASLFLFFGVYEMLKEIDRQSTHNAIKREYEDEEE